MARQPRDFRAKSGHRKCIRLPGLALASQSLFSRFPGGSLYGLQHSNPVAQRFFMRDRHPISAGVITRWQQPNRRRKRVWRRARINASGVLVGALGVSGDSSCADHNIAWRTRHNLLLDYVPGGVSGNASRPDNIVYDITSQAGQQEASAKAAGGIRNALLQPPVSRPVFPSSASPTTDMCEAEGLFIARSNCCSLTFVSTDQVPRTVG